MKSLDETTLTFYYDDLKSTREGTVYGMNTGMNAPGWVKHLGGIPDNPNYTKVIFDPSFTAARPTSCYFWFSDFDNLTAITGLEYLNTSEVTNMCGMFHNCIRLATLDVTKFNTEKVTDMSGMFSGCFNLSSLDVDKFNTENVKNMWGMFQLCRSLTNIDISGFDTHNVIDMRAMFQNCSSVTRLDVSHFNTGEVEDMGWMFENCSSLTTLDLTNFNTEFVVRMENMFNGCSNLTDLDLSNFNTERVRGMKNMFSGCCKLSTIKVGVLWNTNNLTIGSSDMFKDCTSLIGEKGTTYNDAKIDKEYAHVDGGTSNPGYLLKGISPYAVVSADETTLSFYYDDQWVSREGAVYGMNWKDHGARWARNSNVTQNITTVIFDGSFADARPFSCREWFSGFVNLTKIENIEYLNTEKVINMSMMFYDCCSLTALDVTKFKTDKVKNMHFMFYCSGSSNLTVLDLTNFNTANVEDMGGMFRCSRLTTILINVSNWKTDKVTTNSRVFECSELIGDKGTTMYKLLGGGIEYAHVDEGPSNPGYLTTGKYKIFYNGIDEKNATLDTYTGAITEFMNEEVALVEPKKDGYAFAGWTGTTITGLTTPTQNVKIAATEVGNRIYTAHWKRVVSKTDITPLISLSKTYDCTSDVYTTAGKKLDGNPNNEDSYLEYADQVTGETIRCLVKAEYVDANGDATASSVDAIGIKVSAVNDANGKQIIQIKNGGSYSLTEDYVFQDLIFDQTDGVKIDPYVIHTADFTPSYSDLLAEGNVFSTEKAFDGTADVAFSNNITNVPGINYQHPNIPCGDVFVNIISAKLIDNNNQPITEQGSGYGLEVVFELNNPDYIFENNTKTIALQYPANEVNGKITPATEDIEITFANVDADGCIVADASNEHFCKGKAVIEFTVAKGNPQNYSIEFDGGEISSQSGAITGNSIEIALPKELLPDTYIGTIELADANGKSTGKLPLKVIVQLPYYTIVTLYNDVAAVNQLAGEFSAYKWTENGSEISGANSRLLQYSFNKSSVYTAILTKTDGGSYETCPLDLSRITEGGTEVNVYPNPGNSLNDVYVEITRNYQPDANNRIFIYNLNGCLAKQINAPQEKNTIQLPSGNYSGVYIQNGEKVPFKLIVK
ncbi:MAG: BspA family leucine-rich repeat surface protein [Bacteroidales bacterium]|nr:BspA family leucine-rich repeat surface protein [Bacteroidales bacterium]